MDIKVCPICKKKFRVRYYNQITCSDIECQKLRARKKKDERKRNRKDIVRPKGKLKKTF
jgi:hypothetical protein